MTMNFAHVSTWLEKVETTITIFGSNYRQIVIAIFDLDWHVLIDGNNFNYLISHVTKSQSVDIKSYDKRWWINSIDCVKNNKCYFSNLWRVMSKSIIQVIRFNYLSAYDKFNGNILISELKKIVIFRIFLNSILNYSVRVLWVSKFIEKVLFDWMESWVNTPQRKVLKLLKTG